MNFAEPHFISGSPFRFLFTLNLFFFIKNPRIFMVPQEFQFLKDNIKFFLFYLLYKIAISFIKGFLRSTFSFVLVTVNRSSLFGAGAEFLLFEYFEHAQGQVAVSSFNCHYTKSDVLLENHLRSACFALSKWPFLLRTTHADN